ncbi:MAG: DUF1571 domain-containing protein [Planctomycetaceae bacterium]|nr:DUF1571 domain-containing protein [Planctomycetaceae bacterium]
MSQITIFSSAQTNGLPQSYNDGQSPKAPPQQNQGYVTAPSQQPYAGISPQSPISQPTLGVTSVDVTTLNPNHPLVPIIKWAQRERPRIRSIKDYTCTLVKQESVNGKELDPCALSMKIRNEPFSVYAKYLEPTKKAGTEAIFVAGQNKGKLWAKGVGILSILGTQSLAPDGKYAMDGNKYPITEVGLARLVDLLIEVGEGDVKNNYECKVQYYEKVAIGQRNCTCIEVIHPKPTPGKFPFYIARIFIDNELQLPIKYESYDWPKKPEEKPQLLEVYLYHDLKLNVGLTDKDFDIKNSDYHF